MANLDEYGRMIADHARMDPYVFALKEAIEPNSIVLDIGTGTGIHALLACKFGARKVYAIEPNDSIHLAKELARANGFADRIDFIQGFSTSVNLPERADTIVSDLRGILPLYADHIPSIIDARQRFLVPGGILIPRRDTLWVAVVEARSVYRDLVKPWVSPYGLTMEKAKQRILNSWGQDGTDAIRAHSLLTEPIEWAVLDYATIENPSVRSSDLKQEAVRDGTAHGLLVWFDAELAKGIHMRNGPHEKQAAEVYGRGFFPLLEPVPISKGDTIALDFGADLVDGEYDWSWHTRIYSEDNPQAIKADFRQSTSAGSSSIRPTG
jgi:protein arginine N-methyltransferase 1